MKVLLGFILALSICGNLSAQRNVSDSTIRIIALGAEFGFQYPFADMAQRFGYGGVLGAGLSYKTKSNWTVEGHYSYFFGNQIKEDTILKPILTSNNEVLNGNAEAVDVMLQERGFVTGFKVGKIFPFIGPNPNSGMHMKLGVGFMQHKIRIQENSQTAVQVLGDYAKGYDRLSNGLMFSQSIGYTHFSNYKLINYYVGIEFYEGITENRRTINYDTGVHDGRVRTDIIGSVVLRWYFPIYKRQPQDFYFY